MARDTDETGQERVPVTPSARLLPGIAVFHLLILAVCVTAFVMTLNFASVPPPLRRGMAPETFPRVIMGLVAILTLASLIRETRGLAGQGKAAIPAVFFYSAASLLGLFLVGAHVDLLLAIGLFVGCVMWLWGERRPLLVGGAALVVPAVLFLLFSEVLGIRFPRGPIVNLIYG